MNTLIKTLLEYYIEMKNKYLLILLILVIIFLITVYGASQREYFMNFGTNNLISNGSFEGGKDVAQKIKVEGNNQIVILENPGKTSYVLKQTHVPQAMNYYLLRLKVEPSENYILSFWYHCEDGSDLEQTLLKLEIKDKNHRNSVIQGNTTIDQKAEIEGRLWNHVQFFFQVPTDVLDQMLYIYIGYNMINGIRYYTDISLEKHLADAPDFEISDGLQVFLQGSARDPSEHIHNSVWKDISQKGHDFVWDGKPKYDPEGFYRTYGNLLQGPAGKDVMANNVFSIGINMTLEETLENIPVETERKSMENYREVLRIGGNNKFAVRMWLPLYYGNIILDVADERYESNKQVLTKNNNIYTLVYDGSSLKIYLNNAELATIVPKNKIHFNHQPILINNNKNMRAKLYNFIVYNRALNYTEISKVVKYMNQCNKGEKSTIQRWFQTISQPIQNITTGNSNCNGNAGQCQNSGNGSGSGSGSGNCPKVEQKNGEYFVFIPSGSKLEKDLGYCGYKSYGKHQANARKMFKLNFSECQVPEILIVPPKHKNFGKCPYIVRDGNPCFSEACAKVDWSIENPDEANLSENCKRDINHYCERYNQYDPACHCWSRTNRNNEECVKYRRKFLNPNDFNCQIKNFRIDQHPDISDYVRKDEIPCWGCNLGSNGDGTKNNNSNHKKNGSNNNKTLSRNWNDYPFQ